MVTTKNHNPILCESVDCRPCLLWWDGREVGYAEAALAFMFYSPSEHTGNGHTCAVCQAVADLRDLWRRDFKGYPGPSPEVRFEQLVISRHMREKPEVEPVKPKVVTPRPIRVVRPRLELVNHCLDCGIGFEPVRESGGRCRSCRRARKFA